MAELRYAIACTIHHDAPRIGPLDRLSVDVELFRAFEQLRANFLHLASVGVMGPLPGLSRLYDPRRMRKLWVCPQRCGQRDDCEEEMCALERLLDACSIADVKGWREDNLELKPLYRRIMRVVCRLRVHYDSICDTCMKRISEQSAPCVPTVATQNAPGTGIGSVAVPPSIEPAAVVAIVRV